MSTSTLNVSEWTPEQVAAWLSGLGSTVAQYVPQLRERGLNGVKLLMLRCDDLEYLGVHVIGHQELILEAVEHLRNFHYEAERECVQQLAWRVASAAESLARSLRSATSARLATQALADAARTVHAIKPLVCWLDRCGLARDEAGSARAALLLRLALEAATSAHRERFAEQPAGAVRAAAVALASHARRLALLPCAALLAPCAVAVIGIRVRPRQPLGFELLPSACGSACVARVRFGSPAHASALLRDGDEILQVGDCCVVGWPGPAVAALLSVTPPGPAPGAEIALRVRRAAPAAQPAAPCPRPTRRPRLARLPLYADHRLHLYHARFPETSTLELDEYSGLRGNVRGGAGRPSEPTPTVPPVDRAEEDAEPSSSDSEPLSPPASPPPDAVDAVDATDVSRRLYGPRPRVVVRRRHSVCGGAARRRGAELWEGGRTSPPTRRPPSPEPADASDAMDPDCAFYRRDKAVSYSTGLELSPRPRTCLGVALHQAGVTSTGPLLNASFSPEDTSVAIFDDILNVAPNETPVVSPNEAFVTLSKDQLSVASENVCPDEAPAVVFNDSPPVEVSSDIRILVTADTKSRGKLDKCQSAPTYDSDGDSELPAVDLALCPPATVLAPEVVRRSSDSERVTEAINVAVAEGRARRLSLAPPPPPRPRVIPAPYPPLRVVAVSSSPPTCPLKPLRHVTAHDIRLVVSERRRLPPINVEPAPPPSAPTTPTRTPSVLSPTAAVVRGIFPSSKTKSLKKKNSIIARGRLVGAREAAAIGGGGAAGAAWQRVRARGWRARWLVLCEHTLFAYRGRDCAKAVCLVRLQGCTVSAAAEVKSRAHAFKVYHTGNAVYFAADSRDQLLAWLLLLQRATLSAPPASLSGDTAHNFSETDSSAGGSDSENLLMSNDNKDELDKEKDKEKGKFGSLKKLTHRSNRSESHENVSQTSTSLDRKYLRFFSRSRQKDEQKPTKTKQSGVPVPTEHYRSYRRVQTTTTTTSSSYATTSSTTTTSNTTATSSTTITTPTTTTTTTTTTNRVSNIPAPINYIHASNPNLLDFDKSDFVTKPTIQVGSGARKAESGCALVTLEQFMLHKQAEERKQLYCERLLLGVPPQELQRQLDEIVPDVIYGELPVQTEPLRPPNLPDRMHRTRPPDVPERPPPNIPTDSSDLTSDTRDLPLPVLEHIRRGSKPISVTGRDGYEKIVYPDEEVDAENDNESASPSDRPERSDRRDRHDRLWRDSFKRNDKVAPRVLSGPADGQTLTSGQTGQSGPPRPPLRNQSQQPEQLRQQSQDVGVESEASWGNYPHLQCPPVFRPQTYCLTRRPPPDH